MSRGNNGGGLLVLGLAALFILSRKKETKDVIKKTLEKVSDTGAKINNSSYLEELHPVARKKFEKFLNEIIAYTGFSPIITSGYRSFEKQAQLKRENAKNAAPGTSKHNFGLAIDINLLKNGRLIRKSSPKKEWLDSGVISIANRNGLNWGGEFKNYYDPVHFEVDFPTSKLLELKKKQGLPGNKLQIPGLT